MRKTPDELAAYWRKEWEKLLREYSAIRKELWDLKLSLGLPLTGKDKT